MMTTSRRVLALAVAGATFLAQACGRGAAEQALAAAGASLEAATPELQKYVPEEVKALTEAMARARTAFARGDYKRTLAAAQELVPRIQATAVAAQKKKEELATTFGGLKDSLPILFDSLKGRLGKLASTSTLPAGLDQETVATAQANLSTLTQSWSDALAQFERGEVVAAVTQASDVKTRVEELARVFLPARAAAKKP